MNARQKKLWDNLINLTNTNESFYFIDKNIDDITYRCFSYRIASYTDFLNPDALECRGHLFEVKQENNITIPIRLVCWPPNKFFNLNENPMTMDLDISDIKNISLKADGSLISTFLHKNELNLKSKTSLNSEQSIDATEWLNLPKNNKLKEELFELTKKNLTINLEWCSRKNQIVIGYDEPRLIVLSIRDNDNGNYLYINESYYKDDGTEILLSDYNEIIKNWVEYISPEDPKKFILTTCEMKDIEGFVVTLNNGIIFKIKTDWYCSLHKLKDNIKNVRNLFEAVVDETIDDLKSLFINDPWAIQKIFDMEQNVKTIYYKTLNNIEKFYEDNKHLNRKEYAILGQKILDYKEFWLVMLKYNGEDINLKEWMKKNFDSFNLK